jgi:hypothetical protein
MSTTPHEPSVSSTIFLQAATAAAAEQAKNKQNSKQQKQQSKQSNSSTVTKVCWHACSVACACILLPGMQNALIRVLIKHITVPLTYAKRQLHTSQPAGCLMIHL